MPLPVDEPITREAQIFGGNDEAADVQLADIGGIDPVIVAVLEEGGYRTLNDIIDLDRDDFLRLPGIAPEEADRLMSIIDELTMEDEGGEAEESEDEDAQRNG